MADPSAIAGAFTGIVPKVMLYMTYIVYSAVAIGGLYIFYLYMTFKIKVDIYPLYGSGQDGIFSIGKRKKNYVKWNKQKTAWKTLFPFGNRKEREPIDSEFIYFNRVIVFDLNGEWIPGRININKTEDEIRGEINPTPYYIRNWQSLQFKKAELEFSQTDWWSENKTLFIALAIGIACLVACCVTVWLSYKQVNQLTPILGRIGQGIRDINVIPGAPQ